MPDETNPESGLVRVHIGDSKGVQLRDYFFSQDPPVVGDIYKHDGKDYRVIRAGSSKVEHRRPGEGPSVWLTVVPVREENPSGKAYDV